jgi:peptidoglycan/LPS O-acetylase OafA/YrhL
MKGERVYAIDTLRGLAAIVVILWHYQFFFNTKPLEHLLRPFYTNGQAAVDVFFVISGFVLSHVYMGRVSDANDFWRYLVKRIARLYPLHLVTLLVTAALFGLFLLKTGFYGFVYRQNDLYHFALNLGLLQYAGPQAGYSFNGPSWSISTEFWINILFGVGLMLVPRRQILLVSAIAAVSAWSMLTCAHMWVGGPKWGGRLEQEFVRTACGFYAGVVVRIFWARRPSVPALAELSIILGTASTVYLMSIPQAGPHDTTIGAVITLIGAPLMVFGCASSAAIARACSTRIGRWLGEISSSTYMWHFRIAAILVLAGCDAMPHSSTWLPLTYLILVFSAATASYRFVEMPARKRIVNWMDRRFASALGSTA